MIFAGSWWPRCKMQAVQSRRLRLCQVEMCSQVSANLGFWDKTCNVRYRFIIANANCFNNFWFNRIGKNTPSPLAIAENANVLARFVAFVWYCWLVTNCLLRLQQLYCYFYQRRPKLVTLLSWQNKLFTSDTRPLAKQLGLFRLSNRRWLTTYIMIEVLNIFVSARTKTQNPQVIAYAK